MCEYCEKPAKYIAESIEVDDNEDTCGIIVDPYEATINVEKFSADDPLSGSEVVLTEFINYCPMCGEPIFQRRAR